MTDSDVAPATDMQVLTLDLGGQRFGLETHQVREVLDLAPLTAVPGAQPWLRGLINVRGKVVPVLDLCTRFRMEAAAASADTRIVVLEVTVRGRPELVGLLADRVLEVADLPAATLSEPPRLGMAWRPEFIRSLGRHDEDVVIVMDIDRVLATDAGRAGTATP